MSKVINNIWTDTLLSTFILFGLVACFNQRQNQIIAFKDVKKNYNRNDGFSFKLQNNSDTTFYYCVGLEGKNKGSWITLVLDLNKEAPDRAEMWKTIAPLETKEELHDSPAYFSRYEDPRTKKENLLDITSYRFNITYTPDYGQPFTNRRVHYSSEFSIK